MNRFRYLLLGVLCAHLLACDGADSHVFQVSVSGSLKYQDKIYDGRGFTGDYPGKAIRFAEVQLVDGNVAVASTRSDENGYYQLQGQGVRLKVRILAQSDAGIDADIAVANQDGDIYAVSKSLAVDGESELDFMLPITQDVTGAFNVLDVLSNGKQFIAQYDSTLTASLRAYWVPGNSEYGTYYCSLTTSRNVCPQGRGIYLVGGWRGGGDTDQFDDDVILHEFGHFIEDQLHIQDSPGGTHYLSDTDSDIRLSWSEGWGGFMPGAVKTWLADNHPDLLSSDSNLSSTYFVDTYGDYAMISMDLGDPESYYCWSGSRCYSYSSSEVAVANVLNGLNKSFGFDAIWNSVSAYLPYETPFAASLETFWDGWVTQRNPDQAELSNLYNIFGRSSIYYRSDNYEADNSYVAAKPYTVCPSCSSQQRYLYNSVRNNDTDYAYLNLNAGKTYSIETTDLGNAADTYIRILNQDGSQAYSANGALMANDNRPGTVFCAPLESPCKIHNDGKMLSSLLQFTPDVSSTYIVEIATSSARPISAGRYGSYKLLVQELP